MRRVLRSPGSKSNCAMLPPQAAEGTNPPLDIRSQPIFRADSAPLNVPVGNAAIWVRKSGYCRPGLGQAIKTPSDDVDITMMKSARIIVTVDFAGAARHRRLHRRDNTRGRQRRRIMGWIRRHRRRQPDHVPRRSARPLRDSGPAKPLERKPARPAADH